MVALSTLEKFGFPQTLIKEYRNWYLLLRPKQVTVGSLVLICKDRVTKFSAISPEGFQEYPWIISEVEWHLSDVFHYDKINYLMLMMVDLDVHQHIIPRYGRPRRFHERDYQDFDWPNMPTLQKINDMEQPEFFYLRDLLAKRFSLTPNPLKRFKRIYTTGCFDLFHMGHLNILRRSKEICDYLLVGVSTDELMEKEKGRRPVIPFAERMEIIRSIKYVDEVIPQLDKNKQKIVDQYHIEAITVGDDWKGKYPPVSCEVIYFPYTKKISSGALKVKIEEI